MPDSDTRVENTMFFMLGKDDKPAVKGGSTDEGHKDWSGIISYKYGVTAPIGAGAGGTQQAGKATLKDVTIIKYMDKASPALFEAVAQNKYFDTAKIDYMSADGKTKLMSLTMDKVKITSFDHGADDRGVPTEILTLHYDAIKKEVTASKDGKDEAPTRGGHRRSDNKAWA